MFVKICGITRLEDAVQALQSGASALGFVLWPKSPRFIAPAQVRAIVDRLPEDVTTIGVFVDEPADGIKRAVDVAGLRAVQVNDDARPEQLLGIGRPVFKVVTLTTADRVASEWPDEVTLLLDAHDPVRRGGTGVTVDWSRAGAIARRRRLVLAGGLTPGNVADAIAQVQPYGVDVCSGVEAAPGVKDHGKLSAFIAKARHGND
jgi:phosphoribosylanthranilate isomerase